MIVNPYQSPSLPPGTGANKPFAILMIVVWTLLAIPLGAAVSLVVTLIGLMFTLEMHSGIKELACLVIGFVSGLAVIAGCWSSGFSWFQNRLTTDH